MFCSICVLFCLWSSKQNRTAHTTRSDVPVEEEHVDAPLADHRHALGGIGPLRILAGVVVLTLEEHGDGDAAAHGDRCPHGIIMRNKDLVYLVVHVGSLGDLRRTAPGSGLAQVVVRLVLLVDGDSPLQLGVQLHDEAQHVNLVGQAHM